MFIDKAELEGLINRRIINEAGGRVCNPTISPRHRGDKINDVQQRRTSIEHNLKILS